MALSEKAVEKAGELVKPIYEDAMQPAVQELGQGLKAALSVLMAPWKALGIASDAHLQAFKDGYEAKIKQIPAERLVTPDLQIAGNVLGVLAYTVQEPSLREMFENLLATASDSDTTDQAHPSFVEIIKQLSSSEAKYLKEVTKVRVTPIVEIKLEESSGSGDVMHRNVINISDIKVVDEISHFIDNWIRLRIVEVDYSKQFSHPEAYSSLEAFVKGFYPDAVTKNLGQQVAYEGKKVVIEKGALWVTQFGSRFLKACLTYSP